MACGLVPDVSRTVTAAAAVILVVLAGLLGTFATGLPFWAGMLVLAGVGYGIVARSYRPYEAIEDAARRSVGGDTAPLRALDLPPEADRAAAAVENTLRSAQRRARDLESRLADQSTLMDRMEEGVLAIDDDGRLRVVNRAAREIVGLVEQIGPKPTVARVKSAEFRAVLDTALQTAIRPREITVDGREILVESHGVDGGAIVSLRDVTDVRRLEQVRTDFVANASHELKTPLTSVRGFAETLLDDEDAPPDVRRQFLNLIFQNTIRLQNIVEDLLDLSRLESGGWSPELEPVDVVRVAEDSWARIQEGRRATQSFRVRGAGWASADHGGLHHILRNLLDNAVRHTEPDGTIEVVVTRGREVCIAVRDDGTGIPPDALPRIFERFFRVDKARSRAQGGTGLGLAIVSHLVSRMGGRLDAQSQYGVGTTIRIWLPAAEEDAEEEA